VGENQHRKRSSYIEKGCFEKSRNYNSTGDRTAELNIPLEDPVFTNTVRRELHKSYIHGRAAIAKPMITESSAQMRKRWCQDHKTWKRAGDMVRRFVLHAVPCIRKRLRLDNTRGNLQSGMPVSNSETREKYNDGLGSNIVVQYCRMFYRCYAIGG
jgi:hypothetical protein